MSKRRILLVERDEAETYLLTSVIAFGATIILVRLFLELTGYPQVGGGTLHIAHLLWGGLLMFIAIFLVLIWDNPVFLLAAAVLSGIGIGLFIDEVGKFITQNNDYFFPAAAPIIYGFFLLTVLIYIIVRQPDEEDPRRAMVLALEQLQDAIYGELDDREVKELLHNLGTARQAEKPEIREMATVLHRYVDEGNVPFKDYRPNLLRRAGDKAVAWGQQLGRAKLRILILVGLGITAVGAVATLGLLLIAAFSADAVVETLFAAVRSEAQTLAVNDVRGVYIRTGLELLIGLVALTAIFFILRGKEKRGMVIGLASVVLSLTAV
ncbi:MAG TPA: hypothetical protein ENJ93_03955, partial [Chloroflexi bacterium]|nr:hypothetical protein [Chloroflexota bacterium]